jgi:hypothetical protein
MVPRFLAVADPTQSLLADAASLAPTNPFVTAGFVASRRRRGVQPWLLCVDADSHLVSACVAFVRSGRINCSLEISSLTELPRAEPFWQGLLRFCAAHRVTQLEVNSFASTVARIPKLPGEQHRTRRCEHVLDLQTGDLVTRLTAHHRRSINRARKRGLSIVRATDERACDAHVCMLQASMERRKRRGEPVQLKFARDDLLAMVESGLGELFQAVADGQVLASTLILRASRGAYLQTTGTSAVGMASGASHLVVHDAAVALQSEGRQVFNLGGAGEEHPGLRRFKSGFGARPVELEAADFYLAGPLKRMLTRAARSLRRYAQAVTAASRRSYESPPAALARMSRTRMLRVSACVGSSAYSH